MLSWEAKKVDEWQKLDGWHNDAQQSNSFYTAEQRKEKYEDKKPKYWDDPEVVASATAFEPFYKACREPGVHHNPKAPTEITTQ